MKQTPPYPAPNFKLSDASGTIHSLGDYHGRWLVLYFYPKDDTPGCTLEACGFRDARDDLQALGAVVVGISKDDAAAHEAFKAKYSLSFDLLSDPTGQVIEAYGAWGPKMFGHKGILRKTFIIDKNGVVQKVYGRVIPTGHSSKVVSDLRALQNER